MPSIPNLYHECVVGCRYIPVEIKLDGHHIASRKIRTGDHCIVFLECQLLNRRTGKDSDANSQGGLVRVGAVRVGCSQCIVCKPGLRRCAGNRAAMVVAGRRRGIDQPGRHGSHGICESAISAGCGRQRNGANRPVGGKFQL